MHLCTVQVPERDQPAADDQLQAPRETIPQAAGRALGRGLAHLVQQHCNQQC